MIRIVRQVSSFANAEGELQGHMAFNFWFHPWCRGGYPDDLWERHFAALALEGVKRAPPAAARAQASAAAKRQRKPATAQAPDEAVGPSERGKRRKGGRQAPGDSEASKPPAPAPLNNGRHGGRAKGASAANRKGANRDVSSTRTSAAAGRGKRAKKQ